MALAKARAVGKGARGKARAPDRQAPGVSPRRLVGVTVVLAEQGQEAAIDERNMGNLPVLGAELSVFGQGGFAARPPPAPKEEGAGGVPELDIVRLTRVPFVPFGFRIGVEDPAGNREGTVEAGSGGGPAWTPQSAGETPGRRAGAPQAETPRAPEPAKATAEGSALDVAFKVEAPGSKAGDFRIERGLIGDHGPHGDMEDHRVVVSTRGIAADAEDAFLGGGCIEELAKPGVRDLADENVAETKAVPGEVAEGPAFEPDGHARVCDHQIERVAVGAASAHLPIEKLIGDARANADPSQRRETPGRVQPRDVPRKGAGAAQRTGATAKESTGNPGGAGPCADQNFAIRLKHESAHKEENPCTEDQPGPLKAGPPEVPPEGATAGVEPLEHTVCEGRGRGGNTGGTNPPRVPIRPPTDVEWGEAVVWVEGGEGGGRRAPKPTMPRVQGRSRGGRRGGGRGGFRTEPGGLEEVSEERDVRGEGREPHCRASNGAVQEGDDHIAETGGPRKAVRGESGSWGRPVGCGGGRGDGRGRDGPRAGGRGRGERGRNGRRRAVGPSPARPVVHRGVRRGGGRGVARVIGGGGDRGGVVDLGAPLPAVPTFPVLEFPKGVRAPIERRPDPPGPIARAPHHSRGAAPMHGDIGAPRGGRGKRVVGRGEG